MIDRLDIALPIGLALVFAGFRYRQFLNSDLKHVVPRAAVGGVKSAVGLSVVTLGYEPDAS